MFFRFRKFSIRIWCLSWIENIYNGIHKPALDVTLKNYNETHSESDDSLHDIPLKFIEKKTKKQKYKKRKSQKRKSQKISGRIFGGHAIFELFVENRKHPPKRGKILILNTIL